ncbi:hypothetical protein BCR44DRAFT_312697 [Catenaria anguillulae PL171]|uniref:Uncharacterized protein n=1 Tax=Catenaria anguillulae PL171 TaxID=765915 RepID=A0A1Y2HFQ0_9FUNG|nr:hypothetical protein BCR44DRAFT_312697 [Catenaria anguillulae PL171]
MWFFVPSFCLFARFSFLVFFFFSFLFFHKPVLLPAPIPTPSLFVAFPRFGAFLSFGLCLQLTGPSPAYRNHHVTISITTERDAGRARPTDPNTRLCPSCFVAKARQPAHVVMSHQTQYACGHFKLFGLICTSQRDSVTR